MQIKTNKILIKYFYNIIRARRVLRERNNRIRRQKRNFLKSFNIIIVIK